MKKTIFLGGTCNDSLWRDALIPQLPNADCFNPVVPNWNDEAYQKELKAREISDVCLYVITPKMTGVYSIAEVIDDSNKRPGKTVFHYMNEDTVNGETVTFNKARLNSLKACGKMVRANGGYWAETMEDLITYLNK